MVPRALVADEEEGLVLRDRAAGGPAELVVAGLGLLAGVQRGVTEPHRPGLQVLVAEALETGSVECIGAALGPQVDRGSAGQPLLGAHAAGDDVDLLDRVERW